MQKRNSILVLLSLIFGFFAVVFLAIPRFFGAIIGKPQKPIKENSFLDALNFVANIGPKSFWKKPTALKIGRSISTFLHYVFDKGQTFFESSKSTEVLRAKKKKDGFTLIEMIVSITLFAIILVAAFAVFGNIGTSRLGVSNQLDLNKDVYFAVERFAALIKEGGTVDYEEYWNRRQVGTTVGSGHYLGFSQFGNGGAIYQCSGNSGAGCASGTLQKYGEYKQQFIDVGVDTNNDGLNPGDDDDEDLGKGPEAFTGGEALSELYLIKKTELPHERLFFRLNVIKDAGNTVNCNGSTTSSGCIGNLQMLRLVGSDSNNDGKTDSWNCNKDYCAGAPTGPDSGWANVFPDYINVKEVKFFISPTKDVKYAWKETAGINAPYVRVYMKLGFSAERRKMLKGADPSVVISTTINLE